MLGRLSLSSLSSQPRPEKDYCIEVNRESLYSSSESDSSSELPPPRALPSFRCSSEKNGNKSLQNTVHYEDIM